MSTTKLIIKKTIFLFTKPMVDLLRVGILIYDGVNLLQLAAPHSTFSVASLPSHEPDKLPTKLFNVFTFSEEVNVLETEHGAFITPDYDLESVPMIDILIVPGGNGVKRIRQEDSIIKYINEFHEEMEIIGTISNGARIIALTGLANGRRMTTSKDYIEEFSKEFPEIKVVSGFRYLDDDIIVSSAGPSSGLDLGLYIVYKMFGVEAMNYTAEKLDYVFTP